MLSNNAYMALVMWLSAVSDASYDDEGFCIWYEKVEGVQRCKGSRATLQQRERSGQRWQRHNEEVSILNIITAAISLHYDLSILTNNESCNQTHPSSQLLDKTSSSAVLSTSLELH